MSEDTDGELLATGGGIALLSELQDGDVDTLLGRTIGEYRITALMAEGGMSRVYRAQRVDGSFDRDVAIKVSPMGGFNAEMRQRFLREQTLLAGLNHPNICQLYDALVTAEGWPCLVMELVEGEPIDRHCERQRLSTRERVALLVDVVDAVAYAHARLVVHRDIKPSNVLVDGEQRARLLDFGIAKLLDPSATALTQAAPMTPAYASPEQLLGQDVTTASDISQLGVLIYEVLTGERLNADVTLSQAIQRAAESRATTLSPAVRRSLPEELAVIIEQCLRPDPEERYRDANALQADLRAYLRGYPVSAAGQSPGYRLRKLIGRNRAATALLSGAAVALVASTAWYTMAVTAQRDDAERQEAIAVRALEFVVSFFSAADPFTANGLELTARDILERGAARIEEELADEPVAQDYLYFTIASTYWRLGELDQAEEFARRAIDVRSRISGRRSNNNMSNLNVLASVLSDKGELDQAQQIYQEVLEYLLETKGPDHEWTLKTRSNIAMIYNQEGRYEAALELDREIHDRKLAAFGPRAPTTVVSALNISANLIALGRYQDAHELASRNLAVAREVLGPKYPTTQSLMSNVAAALSNQGRTEEVIPMYEELLTMSREVHGENSFPALIAQSRLANAYALAGDSARAEPMFAAAIAGMAEQRGLEHPTVLKHRHYAAATQADLGRVDAARAELDAVIATQTRKLSANHPDTLQSRAAYAELLLASGTDDGADYAATLLHDMQAVLGDDHPRVATLRDMANAATAQIRDQ